MNQNAILAFSNKVSEILRIYDRFTEEELHGGNWDEFKSELSLIRDSINELNALFISVIKSNSLKDIDTLFLLLAVEHKPDLSTLAGVLGLVPTQDNEYVKKSASFVVYYLNDNQFISKMKSAQAMLKQYS